MAEDRTKPTMILASASPRRLQLLQQVGVEPDHLIPADIDETPHQKELPKDLVKRLARTKADVCARHAARENLRDNAYILAADTVVARGRVILPKAETVDQASDCLRQLSGRAHRVFTAVCLIAPRGRTTIRIVETRLRFKRLSSLETEAYLASGEWRGKAGGYAIQGLAGSFVIKLVGSYSSVVGLPLYETVNLLTGEGYPVHFGWLGADI
ncbi:MAG: Maf family nucleotide pyrophosphatase [Pseudomonadota bacterium]